VFEYFLQYYHYLLITLRELLCLKLGGSRRKKQRGLGKVQKSQRSDTDYKVYEYLAWCDENNEDTWFNLIKTHLKMDPTVLRKSLDRLMEDGYVKEYRLYSKQKDRLKRNHQVNYKCYKTTKFEGITT